MKTRKQAWAGMNWITQHRRLAIYLRDGLACCYCGQSVEDGAQLTLDHVKPHSKGGGNESTNLVTACHKCNSLRGNRTVAKFCADVATYTLVPEAEIAKHIRSSAKRELPLAEAKKIVARRGSCFKALTLGKKM